MKMKYKLTDLQMGFPSHYVEDEEDSIYFSSLANYPYKRAPISYPPKLDYF